MPSGSAQTSPEEAEVTVAPLPRAAVSAAGWAIADQASFAGANFLTNLALARWLAPSDYGVYTQVYAVFLLIGTAHTAVLTEPMLVFGAGRHRARLGSYLRTLLRLHWATTGIVAVLTAVAGLVLLGLGNRSLGITFLVLAGAGPAILLQWLARRACYIHPGPRLAASAGGAYLVLSLAGLYALFRLGLLSGAAALALMGGCSLVTALLVLQRLHVGHSAPLAREPRRELVREHWDYGRWALGSGALSWVPGNIYYLLLPAAGMGASATGALRALVNLTFPATHAYAALGTVLIPQLVPHVGTAPYRRHVVRLMVLYGAAAVAYYAALLVTGPALIEWLYRGQYTPYAGLLWLVGAVPIGVALSSVLGAALRAGGASRGVFIAYTWTSLVAAAVGVPLTVSWGLRGAALGLLLASLVTALALFFGVRRVTGAAAAR